MLVCTLGVLNLLGIKDALFGQGLMVISLLITLLVFQIVLDIAALLIPQKMAEQYVSSGLSMGTVTYRFFCVGLIVLSLALLVTASFGNPGTVMIGGSFILTGVVYYLLRRGNLVKKNIHIEDRIQAEIDAITVER